MSDVKQLNDEELNNVTGGTYEYVHKASVAISDLFMEVLNTTKSKQDYENAKIMAYGLIYGYRNLELIDVDEYNSLKAQIDSMYESYLILGLD